MDSRLKVIDFHDCLHGFLSGRGAGTAIMEVKLTQHLAYLDQKALYGIFIDLRKAYDAMDRDRCLAILEAYGVGPNMLRLIKYFWDNAVLVCRAGGYYGTPFKALRGVTQGGPFSPRVFNVMVDAIVREWLRVIYDLDIATDGLDRFIREFLAAFYADDGLVQSRCPERLQRAFDVLIGLFDCVGLKMNTMKTKAMVCVPGKIQSRMLNEVYNNTRIGLTDCAAWQ